MGLGLLVATPKTCQKAASAIMRSDGPSKGRQRRLAAIQTVSQTGRIIRIVPSIEDWAV